MVITTQMSFLFETFYLEKGREILKIRKDMQEFATKRGLDFLENRTNSKIHYRDEVKNVSAGETYLDAWNFGERLIAPDDMVRLFCEFSTTKFKSFEDTQPFQEIHRNIFKYVMEKGFYMRCCHEHPTEPPILFSTPGFSMAGDNEYLTIECSLGRDIVSYIDKKREQWAEPGPLSARERYESRLKPGEKNLFL